jgi:hypothetical protein
VLEAHLAERVSVLARRVRSFLSEPTRVSMPPLRHHDLDEGFSRSPGDVRAARGFRKVDCLVDEVAGGGSEKGTARPQPEHDKRDERLGSETDVRSGQECSVLWSDGREAGLDLSRSQFPTKGEPERLQIDRKVERIRYRMMSRDEIERRE